MNRNKDKLSLIWDKRQRDFVAHAPLKGDALLVMNNILNKLLIWSLDQPHPHNWRKENLIKELESRGYDPKTFRFSIELKRK